MISPTPRLVAAAAFIVIPLFTIGTLVSGALIPSVFLLLLISALTAADGFRGLQSMRRIRVRASAAPSWLKEREALISISCDALPRSSVKYLLSLDLPPAIEPMSPVTVVDARTASVEVRCLPKQRGQFHITRCHLAGVSRARLWHIRQTLSLDLPVRVFPNLEREHGAKLLFFRKHTGQRTERFIGKGREFERLRDYAPGDSFDEISWKATARRGKPVVKLFQVERTQEVYVIIDASRLSARNKAMERFVNAALMVALAAENHGDKFGLVAFSHTVHHFVAASRGQGHFSRCRNAIYDLQPNKVPADFAELVSFLELRIRKRALLLFLTDLSDPMLAETFLSQGRLLARRHVVLVSRLDDENARPLFTGSSPETTEQIYARLSGHLEWGALHALEKNLKQIGIGIRSLRPKFAGIDLVEQYLAIKERQLL